MKDDMSRTEKHIYDTIPDGWKRLEHTNTAPAGHFWISNGKSLFSPEYRQALCKDPQWKG